MCKDSCQDLKAHLTSRIHGMTEADTEKSLNIRNVMFGFIEKGCDQTDLPDVQNGYLPLILKKNKHTDSGPAEEEEERRNSERQRDREREEGNETTG